MPKQFALLESLTCYGQWLPGDQRGYVSNTVSPDGYRPKNNRPGTRCDRDDVTTYRRAKELQKAKTSAFLQNKHPLHHGDDRSCH